jgi:hypothetical protein
MFVYIKNKIINIEGLTFAGVMKKEENFCVALCFKDRQDMSIKCKDEECAKSGVLRIYTILYHNGLI